MLSDPVAECAGQGLIADSSPSSVTFWNASLKSNEGDLIWTGRLLGRNQQKITHRLGAPGRPRYARCPRCLKPFACF